MSFFSNSQNFAVNGGEFLNVNVNNNHVHSGPTGIDILLDASVPEAAVDAEARRYAASCYPGTRTQYINDITSWAITISDTQSSPVYWVKGPAGVGKSAIAQTCAEKIKDAGHLGGAFFFSINGRNDHTRLFITLAYQLSTALPDYREILNDVILKDKSLIKKTMLSQFQSLIFEPLKSLSSQGKVVGRKTIIIDGLDECKNRDAQAEIVQIIGASASAENMPLRWAIFSRPEPHIAAAFDDDCISPLCYLVELPVSREVDKEIELYLRGEFRNMVRRRRLPLSPSWPSDENITKLVEASAGLFAYPATVLRFIDQRPSLRLEDTLSEVLGAISARGRKSISPLTELDAFYTLVLKRIPQELLPQVQLLLCHIVTVDNSNGLGSWRVARLCNAIGLSETEFQGIYHQLHAAIQYQGPSNPFKMPENVNPALSYDNQEFKATNELVNAVLGIHGVIYFHHKSFYDYLVEPSRSSTFCVTTSAMRERLLIRLIQRHNQFSASYELKGFDLILGPNMPNSSTTLSWPQGSEFADSFLKFRIFLSLSYWLSHDGSELKKIIRNVPSSSIQQLSTLDYRKSLIGNHMNHRMWAAPGVLLGVHVLELYGTSGLLPHTMYSALDSQYFSRFDPMVFLKMVRHFRELGIIKPYHPNLLSNFASAVRALTTEKAKGKNYGRYKPGQEERSVIWYWEFDMELEYFHEFQSLEFDDAMKAYKEIWRQT
ncbi:hypothetical protein NP233_g9802 [Leucocoprinus birnbaumii]|uniref:Nephrocystin 3-like N-terminal domain-containing protein n=1 Tax=Leucocoprinus birnbaumii TaxID=56174 RepID=A0AAD5VNA9_9AGAR|nr:hypothetical protein NP233_g9802 [Leucocoprinus birnbaumii]